MPSFHQLWEIIDGPPLMDSGNETQAMAAIRNGLQRGETFWDDFITVCGNAEALSELLDVPKEKVTGWASKIKETISKVKRADDHDDVSDKTEMLPTDNDPTDPSFNQ